MPPEARKLGTELVMVSTNVMITILDIEPIERVTGPKGDEWRAQMYEAIKTEDDVLEHWAWNAVRNDVTDVSQLEGWADVEPGKIIFSLRDGSTEVGRP